MAISNRERTIKEIARKLYLREDVVSDVLEEFQEVAIRALLEEGSFKWQNFFSIKAREYSGYTTVHGEVPRQSRLTVRLAESLRDRFRASQRNEAVSEAKKPAVDPEIWNPLLDDDD